MSLTKITSGISLVGPQKDIFYLNNQTVTQNYTIPSGSNAMSAGPVTIANNVTVTVSDGSTWTIV